METSKEKRIIEASGRLLAEVGPGTFSLEKLSERPEMKGFDVLTLVRNEELIFEQLLLQLEKELTAIVDEISLKQESPELEFEMLFKQLHRLFKQKPYYLPVIFDKDLHRQYRGAEEIISRIKGVARGYLIALIDRGKAKGFFSIEINTKIMVKKILSSFQILMNDMQKADKMIRDLKKYRTEND
jgi:hypothetical protein